MKSDPLARADQIVEEAQARRPRWRSTSRVPSWFAGKELDVLTTVERRELYKELKSRHQAVQVLPFILALTNASEAVHGLRSESTRLVWILVTAGFVFVVVGAWLYRRQSILRTARRHVRESADWPMRSLQPKA